MDGRAAVNLRRGRLVVIRRLPDGADSQQVALVVIEVYGCHVSVYLGVQVAIVYGRDRNSIAIRLQGHIAKDQVAFVQGNGRAYLEMADTRPACGMRMAAFLWDGGWP